MKDKASKDKSGDKVADSSSNDGSTKAGSKMSKVDKKPDVADSSKKVYKKEPMLKKINKGGPGQNIRMLLGAVLVVLFGIGSGWFLSGSSSAQEASSIAETEVVEENGKTAGMPIQNGEEEFDEAEGILEEGGIDGEGTHHLVREGGESKYVYLTSLTLDLQSFVGKTVMVKGETMASQSAPWLMDVWVIKELK
jgi:hypothetical protein